MQLLELEEGAMVRSATGEALGEIERFVVNPSQRQVSHVVVKEGVIFTDHKIVPVELIDHVEAEGPVLSSDVDPEQLEPYESEHYVPVDEVTRDRIDPRLGDASIWRYPTIATGYYPSYPGMPIPYAWAPERTKVREVNVPAGSEVVEEGAVVESPSGDRIGTLTEVTVTEEGQLSHITVDVDDLGEERVVPSHWIESIGDRIVLAVGGSAMRELAGPST